MEVDRVALWQQVSFSQKGPCDDPKGPKGQQNIIERGRPATSDGSNLIQASLGHISRYCFKTSAEFRD